MVQDSRSASYPGAAIASSYDFGSIDFFFSEHVAELKQLAKVSPVPCDCELHKFPTTDQRPRVLS